MGVYSRYKKDPNGFRKLVELLESTPKARRQKMIDVGMEEDSHYTEAALRYILTIEDVFTLEDMELAEVIAKIPARSVAIAIQGFEEERKNRVLRLAPRKMMGELDGYSEMKSSPFEISGAQMKFISVTRELERTGIVKVKAIPEKV